jgi:hypothetical protein
MYHQRPMAVCVSFLNYFFSILFHYMLGYKNQLEFISVDIQ